MTILWVVDAFTAIPFQGNPAAVCVLDAPRDASWMQLVAREMNLSETAFLHPIKDGWSLRWFTPTVEVDLCGHATLASAMILWKTGELDHNEEARFLTTSGWLRCRRAGDWIEMDFPTNIAVPCPTPGGLAEALGCELVSVLRSSSDLLVEVADEATLRALIPDFSRLMAFAVRGIIVTCRSAAAEFDFISRFFAPSAGIAEDPVTGSAHCTLATFWQEKLGKNEFTAYQASARGGVVKVSIQGNRILLKGQAVLMSRVEWLAPQSPE
ncbi:MAG: PhzF family phenazine biosynthesis protein [Chthoniobacterales bacterium]